MEMFILGLVVGLWLGVILKLITVLNPFDLDVFQAAVLAPVWIIGSIILGATFLGSFGYGLAIAGVIFLIVSAIEVLVVMLSAGTAKAPGIALVLDIIPEIFFVVVAIVVTAYVIQGQGSALLPWFTWIPGVGAMAAEERSVRKHACAVSKDRIHDMEGKMKSSGPFMKVIYKGRIEIQKRFQVRACGKGTE